MALSTNQLVYYKFDGNSNDAVGASNGTDTNVSYVGGSGIINQGAGFNGTTSLMTLPSSIARTSGDTTVAGWIKITSFQTSTRIIFWDWTTVNNFLIYTDAADNKLKAQVSGGGGINSAALSTGVYYHFVVTRTGSTAELWINGVSAGTMGSLGGISTPSATIYIGDDSGASSKTSGVIDELGLWTRALSSGEITQLYNGGVGVQYPYVTVYTLTAVLGTYAYTGNSAIIGRLYTLVANVGAYVLTGIDVLLRKTGWDFQTRNTSVFSNLSKHTSSFSTQSKNATVWNNRAKS